VPVLVGVGDATCYNCGRRNPGPGWSPVLRSLGRDLRFTGFIVGLRLHYVLSWALAGAPFGGMLSPGGRVLDYLVEAARFPYGI
jgi:hypothetical protein